MAHLHLHALANHRRATLRWRLVSGLQLREVAMITEVKKYYCDFCGAENIESQFTKVDVRGCTNGAEMACLNCLQKLLVFVGQLRDAGPKTQPIQKESWWKEKLKWL